jgi:hypothetical protein
LELLYVIWRRIGTDNFLTSNREAGDTIATKEQATDLDASTRN